VFTLVLIAYFGVIAFVAYSLRDGAQPQPVALYGATEPQRGDLRRALGLHCCLLPLYCFYGLAAAGSGTGWAGLGLMVAWWFVIAVLLVVWWRQGRKGLNNRVLAWALLAWLTVLLLLFFPWRRTRSLLVPPAGTET
jgi:hypothetical protein